MDRDDEDVLDIVFKALADPGRRALLDSLAESDGQSLTDLCAVLPGMTRFGVMKHLGLLEGAHLVVVEREGRQKLHYLNPVPIRRLYERWVSRYAEPFAGALDRLKSDLEMEEDNASTPARIRDVHQGDAG